MLADLFKLPIAHRGLHNEVNGIIENTAAAINRALTGGYGIECDLHLSGDEVPFVFHDENLSRLTGQAGKLSALSAGQLDRVEILGSETPTAPLRFEKCLEMVNGKAPLIVELKYQHDDKNLNLARAAVKLANQYEGEIAFKSFAPELLVMCRTEGFKGPLGIVCERFVSGQAKDILTNRQRFFLRHLLHFPKSKFDFISCDQEALRLPAVQLFRKTGMPVMTWTITSKSEETAAKRHANQIIFEGFLPEIG